MAGRKKSFKEEEVLEKAMWYFGEHGYEGSDTRGLAKAVGLKLGSLYHSFESKKELFKKAFEYYGQRIEDFIQITVQKEITIKEGIRAVYMTLIDNDHLYGQGCLLSNAIVELSIKDLEIRALTGKMLDKREDQLKELLKVAQEKGEIPKEKDPELLAGMLMSLWHGLHISKKLDRDKVVLKKLVNYSLKVLD